MPVTSSLAITYMFSSLPHCASGEGVGARPPKHTALFLEQTQYVAKQQFQKSSQNLCVLIIIHALQLLVG